MMKEAFTITILPESPADRAESLRKLDELSRQAVVNITSNSIFRQLPLENRLTNLVQDITTARFWGTLTAIDGYWPHHFRLFSGESPSKMMVEMDAVRKWARSSFPDYKIEELLNIAVNQALLRPYENRGWPGTQRPHGVLYEELVEKPGSMFARSVTPDFKRRLNNGRFWESLPQAVVWKDRGVHLCHLVDVLEHNYADLDISFVPRGVAIMRDILGKRRLEDAFDEPSDICVERYQHLVGRIDQAGVADAATVQELLVPYARAVLAWDTGLGAPYFCGVDCADDHRGMFQLKLQSPVLQKYLRQPLLQDCVAKHLASLADMGRCDEKPYDEFVDEVLGLIPDRAAVFERLSAYLKQFGNQELIYASRRKGIELSDGSRIQ